MQRVLSSPFFRIFVIAVISQIGYSFVLKILEWTGSWMGNFSQISITSNTCLTIGLVIGMVLGFYWDNIFKRYKPGWLDSDILTIWHAACLWVGEEPKLQIVHGTKPYPYLKIIEEAVLNQEIPLHFKDEQQELGWSKVKRSAIAEYARKRNLKTKFPF